MQAENRKIMFHEGSILWISKRLTHKRLSIIDNIVKQKNYAFWKKTVIQENETCFIWLSKDNTMLFQLIV